MNRYRKLMLHTLILGVGRFASKGIVLLLTPLYTAILSPEAFGVADLVTQMANLLIPLFCLGLCDGLFRFAIDSEEPKRVFSTALTILFAGGLGFSLLLPLLRLVPIFDGYVLLIGAYVLCANFHSICAQYLRAKGKTTLFAVQGILNTLLTVVFNLLFLLVWDMGALGFVLSVVIADGVMAIALFLFAGLYRDVSPRGFDRSLCRPLLTYSIPYIPTTILWLVISASDRFAVRAFWGENETGLYAAAYKIPTLLTLLCGVFMEAWQFLAVKDVSDEERPTVFRRVFGGYMSFIFLVGSALIALTKPFTKILLADAYFTSWQFVPLLTLSLIFFTLVSFLGSVYFVEKKSVYSMLTALGGAVVNLVLNFVLIPRHGAMGAAVATAISYFSVFLLRAYDVKQYVSFSLSPLLVTFNTLLLLAQSGCLLFGVREWYAHPALFFGVMLLLNGKNLWKFAIELLPVRKKEKIPEKN